MTSLRYTDRFRYPCSFHLNGAESCTKWKHGIFDQADKNFLTIVRTIYCNQRGKAKQVGERLYC